MSIRPRLTGRVGTGYFRIPYVSEDFPSEQAIYASQLSCNWDELLWAALTIGRPTTAHVFEHGNASLYEAIFRVSMVRMALECPSVGQPLQRTSAFRALDPTEKGSINYFLGMTFCKLFASRLLDTPWLLHLDVFKDRLNPNLQLGGSRPDLVGEDSLGRWHAFESKGRSNPPSPDDKQKAKDQANRLVSVGGTNCTLHVGAISYFRRDRLHFYWRDPEPENLDPIKLEINDNDWSHYYRFALALASEFGPARQTGGSNPLGINVDIHPLMQESLMQGAWAQARTMAKENANQFKEEKYQPDGLKVSTGENWQSTSIAVPIDEQ